jgi:hypothetical protein
MAKGTYIKQQVNTLPPWAKGLIAVALVGTAFYVVWQAKKLVEGLKKTQGEKDSTSELNATQNELNQLQNQGEKLSFPLSNYSSSANTIANLLDGCETFTSELAAIEEVIKVVKKPIDWLQLQKSFGTKTIDNCGWMTGETPYALGSLLKEQLDSSGAYTLNYPNYKKSGFVLNSRDILSGYLKSIGVNF